MYKRQAPNGTPVLVCGRKVRIAGRVSMDLITVDLTEVPEARVGSPVVLWGEGLPVDDCLLYTSPSPRDRTRSRMPSSA